MRIKTIKKLAQESIKNGVVQKKYADYALGNLSKSELKMYLTSLKQTLKQQILYVTSATELSEDTQKALLTHYGKQDIRVRVDGTLGGGIVILNNDDIIDLSITGKMRRFINNI